MLYSLRSGSTLWARIWTMFSVKCCPSDCFTAFQVEKRLENSLTSFLLEPCELSRHEDFDSALVHYSFSTFSLGCGHSFKRLAYASKLLGTLLLYSIATYYFSIKGIKLASVFVFFLSFPKDHCWGHFTTKMTFTRMGYCNDQSLVINLQKISLLRSYKDQTHFWYSVHWRILFHSWLNDVLVLQSDLIRIVLEGDYVCFHNGIHHEHACLGSP